MPISDMNSFPKQYSSLDYYFLDTAVGPSSTNTRIPYYSSVRAAKTDGLITMTNSSVFGASFLANTYCQVEFSYNWTSWLPFGISINSNQLSITIDSITAANRLVRNYDPNAVASNNVQTANVTLLLKPGDIIRPHIHDATTISPTNYAKLTVIARGV